jgi:threonine dehydratase
MDIRDIFHAKKRIHRFIRKTPLEQSPFFSKLCEGEVFLKLENLQLTGSYKPRGAFNLMLQMNTCLRENGKNGVVTASTGNHAQGVAYVAKLLGLSATIVVPEITPKTKIDAIRRYDVDLIIHGKGFDESEVKAREIEKDCSYYYVSAYNNYNLIAGQGTIGLEMMEENSKLGVVLVPVAAGALISGITTFYKNLNPKVEVIGVQTKASPVMYKSLKKGEVVQIPVEQIKPTIAESLLGGFEKGAVSFDLVKELIEEIILVEEKDIERAITLFLEHHHQVAEGAGAVGLAALMANKDRFKGKKVGIVISGGNIDLSVLRKILNNNSDTII